MRIFDPGAPVAEPAAARQRYEKIPLDVAEDEPSALHPDRTVLFVSENGMGKRSRVEDFRSQNRGGKGLICYKLTEKTGKLVAMKAVNEENDVIMITNEGIIVRTEVSGISVIGRNTSGVKCMNLGDENVKVAGIAITDKEEEIPEEVSVEEAAQNAEGNESETEDK